MSERVRIYEVGPRDGLQNEATPIPTATKARFIELLALHRETRRRRNAAAHSSPEHVAAIDLLGRIEVEVARIERAMDPPLV
jgi:isopropylmalate/homocitrate/citramalate synthase